MNVDKRVLQRMQAEIERLREENGELRSQLDAAYDLLGVTAHSRDKEKTLLEKEWEEIQRNLHDLSLEPYVDDQIQITRVWNISENLLQQLKPECESWDLRSDIIKDLVSHGYYDEYGCADPLMELSRFLMCSPAEELEIADWLMQYKESSDCITLAKELYRKNNKRDKYIAAAVDTLQSSTGNYWELIKYLEMIGEHDRAIITGLQAIELKKDKAYFNERKSNEIMIFLIKNLYRCGDLEQARILYARAKRRAVYHIGIINNALEKAGINISLLG